MSIPSSPEELTESYPQELPTINDRLYRVSASLLKLSVGGYHTHGQDNIQDEPAIYVASHRSMLDIPPVGVSLLDAGHDPVRFIAKKELWDFKKYPVPGLKWWLNNVGALRVTRDESQAKRSEMDQFITAATGGEDVVVFGEGTRQTGPKIRPLKGGVLLISHKAERPVVPVGVAGTKPFKFGKVQVVFGERIDAGEVKELYKARKKGGLEVVRSKLQDVFDEANDYLATA